jgi:hypothetical protein
MHEALGSIPSTKEKERKRERERGRERKEKQNDHTQVFIKIGH